MTDRADAPSIEAAPAVRSPAAQTAEGRSFVAAMDADVRWTRPGDDFPSVIRNAARFRDAGPPASAA